MTSTTATQTAPGPNPELVFSTLAAYQTSAALHSAIDLGVFTLIGEGKKTVPEIAGGCGASERGTRILCDYLTAMGLLSKREGQYENSPTSAVFLDKRLPSYLGAMANFMHGGTLMEPWTKLTEIIRSGRTSLPGQGSVDPNNPLWVEF